MNWMTRDINKLKEYAKAHGLRVYLRKGKRGSGSAEYTIGKSITLFINSKTTKQHIILSLLHELGHHLDLVRNGPDDEKTNDAQELLVLGSMDEVRDDIPKSARKLIYKQEFRGISYMEHLAKYLNLEIDMKEVSLQQKLDIYAYKFFLDKARFPTIPEINKHKKEIKRGKRNRKTSIL